MASSKKNTTIRQLSVVEQFRVATHNPAAFTAGALLAAIVPFFTFWLSHIELDLTKGYLQPTVALIVGGLVYSAKTVWQWAHSAFHCKWKATGFVLLIEGVMIVSHNRYIAIVALAYLIVINATATGCTIACDDKGKGKKTNNKKTTSSAKARNNKNSSINLRKVA